MFYFTDLFLQLDQEFWNGEYFTCTPCGRKYKWKRSLTQHLRHECGKEPQQICHMCNYKTHHSYQLNRHLRSVHNLVVPNKRSKSLPASTAVTAGASTSNTSTQSDEN